MSYVKSDALAFGIPVPLEDWTAESTLGQATPQAGLPVAVARSNGSFPRWSLTASGAQTAGTEVEVQVVEPGFAPLAGVVVREADDNDWRGRDTPLLCVRTEPLQISGVASRLYPHGIALPSGTRVVAFVRQIAAGDYAVVVAYRSATATSWTTVDVVTGLTTTAQPSPCLVLIGDALALLHYAIDDDDNVANVDVYQSLDEGATWEQSAAAVLQNDTISLTTYTLGRMRAAYQNGQLMLLIGATKTDVVADPREYVFQYASPDGGAHCVQISSCEYCAYPEVAAYDNRFVFCFADESTGFLQSRFAANAYTDLSTTPNDTATASWDIAFAHDYNQMFPISVNVVTDCDHALATSENGLYWLARRASSAGSTEQSCQIVRILGPVTNRNIHNMGYEPAGPSSGYGVWWLQDAGATATDYPTHFCAWGWRGNIEVAFNVESASGQWDDQLWLTDLGGNSTVTQPLEKLIRADYLQACWIQTWMATSVPTVARYGWTLTGAGTTNITTTPGWLYLSTSANQAYYTKTKTSNYGEIRMGGYFRRVSGGAIGADDIACSIRLAQAALGYEVLLRVTTTGVQLVDVNAGTVFATVTIDTTGGCYFLLALNEDGQCFAAVAPGRTDGARVYQGLANGDAMTDDGGAGGTDNVFMFGNRATGTAVSEWSEVNLWWVTGTRTGLRSLADGQTNPGQLTAIPVSATASTYSAENVTIRARGGPMARGDEYTIPASAATPQRALNPRGYSGSERSVRGGEFPSPRAGCVATATTGRWAFRVPTAAEQRFPRGMLLFDLQRANFGQARIQGYASGAWSTIGTWAGQLTGLTFAREGARLRITSTGTTYLSADVLADIGYVRLVSGLTTVVRPVSRNSGGILTSSTSLSPVVTIDIDPAAYTGTEPASGDLTIYYGRGTLVVPTATTAQYEAFSLDFQTAPDTYESTPRLGKFSVCEAWCVASADWGTVRRREMNAVVEEMNNGTTRGKILAPIRDVRELPFTRILLDGIKSNGYAEWTIQTGGAVVGLDGNEQDTIEGMLVELGQGTIPGVMVPYIAANGGTRTLVDTLAGVYGRPALEAVSFTLASGTEGTRYASGDRLIWRGEL